MLNQERMLKRRLIIDFKSQDRRSIWKHLDAMAGNYAVYSRHLKGLPPYLSDNDVYLYANAGSVVVVCIDLCPRKKRRAYEESDVIQPLLFDEGEEPRTSVVWKLSETIRLMGEKLKSAKIAADVFGVLLSEAEITNLYDVEDMWESNNIKVIDGFSRLKYRKIEVNDDDDLAEKSIIDALLDDNHTSLQPPLVETPPQDKADNSQTEDVDDEEFERLLQQFIDDNFDSDDEEDDTSDDSDNDFLDDENEGGLDEINLDDFPEGSVHLPDDTTFPNGVIEQNQNISVQVEILRPIANPREELDKLVGCADIKKRMDELLALTSYNKMMRETFPNSRQHDVSLHSVFLGRPGTGKTTVCKIFGSLLRQAGALSKGHVVVCNRGTFIGTLWGDEERSMRQVLEMAQGGVLMIDEAYLLNGKHESDPGKLVVQLMMNILADETQRDIAIVLCGYKEPMQKLLDSNPGLLSRFPNKFEFADFTIDELLEITRRRVNEYEYVFTPPAWEKYNQILTEAYQQRNPQTWGNARFVANLLERIYIQHATRCVNQRPADKCQLRLLTPEDILPIEVPKEKKRIGF